MLNILVKKQLLELGAFLFRSKKSGGLRQKRGVVLMALCYVLLLGVLGFSMAGIADILCGMLCAVGGEWLYFAVSAVISAVAGVVVGIFTTYPMLYGAKDNDMLFAMPIPPRYILISRMIAVYITSFVYSATVYIPFAIMYFVRGYGSVAAAILAFVSYLFLALTVTVLTCLFGWAVAMIAPHIRHKSLVSSALSILAVIGYYALTFRMESFFTLLVTKYGQINDLADSWLLPLALFGRGAAGDILSFLLSSALTAALFALCVYAMGHNFSGLVNAGKGQAKTVYREKTERAKSVDEALFLREVRRFVQMPIYLLNCGLGVLFLVAVGIVALLKGDAIFLAFSAADAPLSQKLIPAGCFAVTAFMTVINPVAAPSVSLEGKSFWILRSLPLDGWKILHAKERLHLAVNLAPSLFCGWMLSLAFRLAFYEAFLLLFALAAFNFFIAELNLFLGIRFANLEWTNPTVPVKQGTAVGLSLLLGLTVAGMGGALALLMSYHTFPAVGLFTAGGLFAAAFCILRYVLVASGPKELERLDS